MRGVRSALCYTLAAAAALVASPPVSGQQYPAKPVKIIVAFAPGGGNDFIARFVARQLSAGLGQQFIVENKFLNVVPARGGNPSGFTAE